MNAPRTFLDLDSGWEFHRRWKRRRWLEHPDGSGEIVDLPHCWNVLEEFQHGVGYYRGRGSYARSFELSGGDPAGESVWELVAGGFVGAGEVWLDGERIARVDGRYLGFRIDLTDRLEAARPATVGVRLDTRHRALALPGHPEPDFLIYGGLANGIRLERRPRLRLEESSVRIEGRGLLGAEPRVDVEFEVRNDLGHSARPRVEWRIWDTPGGPLAGEPGKERPVAAEVVDFSELAAHTISGRETVSIPLPSVRLWDPENPYLYCAEAIVIDGDDRVRDRTSIRFGLREVDLRQGEGLFLNGRRLDLHGANRSESLPGFGSALPRALHRRDAALLKAMGANFVRLSHAPQSPDFLDACDEMGLLVYAEVSSWKSVRKGRWLAAAQWQLQEMIRRDRNRPSFLFWGLGNESRSRGAFVALQQIVRELDPARPTTYAENHLYRARRQGVVGIADLWSINYELDVLPEAPGLSRSGLSLVTECGREAQAQKGSATESVQLDRLAGDWAVMEGHRHLCGHAVWSFADYATLHRKRYRRRAGLFDAWRAPKLAAHLFAARFASGPVLQLGVFPRSEDLAGREEPSGETRSPFCTRVDPGREETMLWELRVITNCESVEILADGARVVVLEGALQYVVPLGGVFRQIEAAGSKDGRSKVACWRRAGAARSIRISRERLGESFGAAVDGRADGSPEVGATEVFTVHVVDSDDLRVEGWSGRLVVSTEGSARAHPYTAAGEILIAGGEGRLFVTGIDRGPSITRLHGPDLEPAAVEIDWVERAAGPRPS